MVFAPTAPLTAIAWLILASNLSSSAPALALLVFFGGLAIGLMRFFWRWRNKDLNAEAPPGRGFSLDDLRKLKAEGKLSDPEFEKLSAAVRKPPKAWHRLMPIPNFKRVREPFCPVCGYDLRATPDRCPECGTVIRH